jgi:hypothetical protein
MEDADAVRVVVVATTTGAALTLTVTGDDVEQIARIDAERTAAEEFSRNISQETDTTEEEEEILLERMKQCLDRLPRSDRDLLSGYFLTGESGKILVRKRLTEARGITPAALRKRIFELRGAIQKCIRTRRISL